MWQPIFKCNLNCTYCIVKDLIALTEEAAKVSGISYVMDAYREEAEKIINS